MRIIRGDRDLEAFFEENGEEVRKLAILMDLLDIILDFGDRL